MDQGGQNGADRPGNKPESPAESAADDPPSIRQHLARRDQIRYLQEFLSSSSFFQLTDSLETSSSDAELEERLAELDYKVKVVRALLSILEGERNAIERWLARTADPDDQA